MRNRLFTNLSAEELRRLVHYDAGTGIFTRRVRTCNSVKVGARLDRIDRRGYHICSLLNRQLQAHRLAWLYVYGVWPPEEIDHINGNPADNRITNLRLATHLENLRNTKRRSNNKSGFKGVCWSKSLKQWRANIKLDGKQTHLGLFATAEEAHAAYCKAAISRYGEFARVA